MRRPLPLLAGVAALALMLTACGDSDGDDGPTAAGCTPDAELTVHAKDALKFDAESYEVSGTCIDVTYVNDGSVAHTLAVKEHKGFKLSMGDTDSGVLELEPGTYRIFCDVAGHEAAGMHAELKVG